MDLVILMRKEVTISILAGIMAVQESSKYLSMVQKALSPELLKV